MDCAEFQAAAEVRGFRLALDDLEEFHRQELLIPFFRVDPEADPAFAVHVYTTDQHWLTPLLQAATEGRVRDPAAEEFSTEHPYNRPREADPHHWHNGYYYAAWQLVDLCHVQQAQQMISLGSQPKPWAERASAFRTTATALVALSTRYLPGVISQLSMPAGVDEEQYWDFRQSVSCVELLEATGVDLTELRSKAERLLVTADMRDPLRDWLRLVRHSSHHGWFKLRGIALECIWSRIAAEVLLRAHEELAEQGILEPLPSLKGIRGQTMLTGRLGPDLEHADSLEKALSELDLSPHPRALVLVEGKTELMHVPALLAEIGLGRPEQVRVQQCVGSNVNPHLVVRLDIAPRIGEPLEDTFTVDRHPTALILVLDRENSLATEQDQKDMRRKLQEAVREEVHWQGGRIDQSDLDFLIRVQTWGGDKYELANFTDDELVEALTTLGQARNNRRMADPEWERTLRAELTQARKDHTDIKVPAGRVGFGEMKVDLAELLWPKLREKCAAELASGNVTVPVLKLVLEVRQIVGQLSATNYCLQPAT